MEYRAIIVENETYHAWLVVVLENGAWLVRLKKFRTNHHDATNQIELWQRIKAELGEYSKKVGKEIWLDEEDLKILERAKRYKLKVYHIVDVGCAGHYELNRNPNLKDIYELFNDKKQELRGVYLDKNKAYEVFKDRFMSMHLSGDYDYVIHLKYDNKDNRAEYMKECEEFLIFKKVY